MMIIYYMRSSFLKKTLSRIFLKNNTKNTKNNKKPHICLLAGEASGDEIGSHLISSLGKKYKLRFSGIGGYYMSNSEPKFKSIFPISNISVMGISDVIIKLPILYKHMYQTVYHIIKEKPEVIISLDNKGFNNRVIKTTKNILKILPNTDPQDIKFILYVAPSSWGLKNQKNIQLNLYDHLFCILPFEEKFYKNIIPTTFVGHPSTETFMKYKKIQKNKSCYHKNIDIFYKKYNHDAHNCDSHNLLLLPGSRIQEVKRNLPLIQKSSDKLNNDINLYLIMASDTKVEKWLNSQIKQWNIKRKKENLNLVKLIHQTKNINKFNILNKGDSAIAASGTVVTDLGFLSIPTIVLGKADKLTEQYFKKKYCIHSLSIPNIIHEFNFKNEKFDYKNNKNKLIPELLFENCTEENLDYYIKKNIKYSKENTQFNSTTVNEIYLSLFSTSQIYSLQHKKIITEIQTPSDTAANKIIDILKSK